MRKIIFCCVILAIVLLSLVFNTYDLDISIALTKHYHGFYEFFDDFGELPIYLGPILFGATYYFLTGNKYKKAMFVSVSFIAYLIAAIKVTHNTKISLNIASIGVCFLISIVLAILTICLFSKVKKEVLDNIKDLVLLGFIVSICSYGCVEVLKYTWGRVRFRDLSADYSEFTRLFHINGLTGNKSFPSGHTNAGTSILLVPLLVPRFTSKRWIKYLTVGLSFGYIFLLAFSRIVVSAHYASDVLFGFVVGFTTLCVTYHILNRKGVINASSNKC